MVLNIYTKNADWLPSLPPRADVCSQLGYLEQMEKKTLVHDLNYGLGNLNYFLLKGIKTCMDAQGGYR
jgi:hypothetical protein